MKKFVISTMVILMSVSSFAQTASKIDTGKALTALFGVAATVKMVGNVSPGITLEDVLAPLKNDLGNSIATGIALGDNGGVEKQLSSYSMQCVELGNSHANCTLQMNRAKSMIGTTVMFEVGVAEDGSVQVTRPDVSVENDA